jgi:hypothetical protein
LGAGASTASFRGGGAGGFCAAHPPTISAKDTAVTDLFMVYPPSVIGCLILLLGPRDVRHVKLERIAYDRVAVPRLHILRLKLRFPMRWRASRGPVQIAPNFSPANFVTLRRNVQDRIDLYRDGLPLCDLEGVWAASSEW